MGFDDLEAAEREHSERGTDDEAADESERTVESGGSAASADGEPSASASSTASGADSATEGGEESVEGSVAEEPAFAFGDVKQSPMYARPEAWAALEDALDLEVVRALRESGVRNEEKRELHDAALRVAAEHPDEIADAVREARRED